MKKNKNRLVGSLLGLVVADAYGVPFEFDEACDIPDPLPNRMTGFGTYNMPPGTWSDDSSLMLIAAESYSDKYGFDFADIMNKFFAYHEFGYMTPHGRCFDIGTTTIRAIDKWIERSDMSGMRGVTSASNGSLMRITPASIYDIFDRDGNFDAQDFSITKTHQLSSITHSHPVALASCMTLTNVLRQLYYGDRTIEGSSDVAVPLHQMRGAFEHDKVFVNSLDRIIRSLETHKFNHVVGSEGFAFDSLYVALRSFYTTDSFASAIKQAVSSGGDTDTNAAITGTLAGMYYGEKGIPEGWIKDIVKIDRVMEIIQEFLVTIDAQFPDEE